MHFFIILLSPFIQTLRPFLASCQKYLALLGAQPSVSMIHVGTFISLSSELAVAATPLQYRLSKGQLYQRMTIKELQVQEEDNVSLYKHLEHVWTCCNNWFPLCKYGNRARPLRSIGWAVCRLLFIHCPSPKTIMSFCITYPTLCECPAPSAGGWTGMSWEQGTIRGHERPHNQMHAFSFFWPCAASTQRSCSHLHDLQSAAHHDARSRLQLFWDSEEFVFGSGWQRGGESTQMSVLFFLLFFFFKDDTYELVCWVTLLHFGPLHQVAPRWKHCVLDTERGFDLVLADLLSERTAHREVRICDTMT